MKTLLNNSLPKIKQFKLKINKAIWFISAYCKAKLYQQFCSDKLNSEFHAHQKWLEQHQNKQMEHFLINIKNNSPYFKKVLEPYFKYLELSGTSKFNRDAFTNIPTMNKIKLLDNFNTMNTQNIDKDMAFELAFKAEKERDFTPTLNDISIGLSSGTSGQRGLFLVSPKEQATWAGVMLGKMLPNGLFNKERIALFLRANNNMYENVNGQFISFKYFDLLKPFNSLLKNVIEYNPTIIVAPAQVLVELHHKIQNKEIELNQLKRVISCAEVLNTHDKEMISKSFGVVHEVYQATEGFLASTCEYGHLHLNEDFLYIEKHWLNKEKTHFNPIITDFSRTTQPIIRYHLNDVLVIDPDFKCSCGSVLQHIVKIDGRDDDGLIFNGKKIFADSISRLLAITLPKDVDYQLNQYGNKLILNLDRELSIEDFENFKLTLNQFLIKENIEVEDLIYELHYDLNAEKCFHKKKRRIVYHV